MPNKKTNVDLHELSHICELSARMSWLRTRSLKLTGFHMSFAMTSGIFDCLILLSLHSMHPWYQEPIQVLSCILCTCLLVEYWTLVVDVDILWQHKKAKEHKHIGKWPLCPNHQFTSPHRMSKAERDATKLQNKARQSEQFSLFVSCNWLNVAFQTN